MNRYFRIMLSVLAGLSISVAADYFQQNVVYDIKVSLEDSLHTLKAYETLTYTNNSPESLTEIWFHLWPNAYKNSTTALEQQFRDQNSTRMTFAKESERGYIDSLKFIVGGNELNWSFHKDWIDAARIELAEPLVPGQSIQIEIPFFVKIPKVFSRFGHSGKHYEVTQWYPKPAVFDKDGWHVMPYLDQGEFYSEFGSFDVHITLPANYRVMATGDLLDGAGELAWLDSLAAAGDSLYTKDKKARKKILKKLQKEEPKSTGTKTLHFHQDNVHDFAWFADPKWIVRKGSLMTADSSRTITLWSMYLPKNAELWKKSIEYLHDAGYWYGRFYGEYPYNHITAVDGDMSAGGGMEYPNITVISSGGSRDLLEFVIMHEVGHNWFYGIIGSEERRDPWLDEGLNEYTNIRYWEKKYSERGVNLIVSEFVQDKLGIGRDIKMDWAMGYVGYAGLAATGQDLPLSLPAVKYDSANYGSMVYGKTAIMMRFLQHYLGETVVDAAMQDYYETWKFRHPGPNDLEAAFARHTTRNLKWFWRDAVKTNKVIDYSVRKLYGAYFLANHGTMSAPVEVAYFSTSGTELSRVWIEIDQQKLPLAVPPETQRIVIDPDNRMPDINRNNNATNKPIKPVFIFGQPDYNARQIFWLPWLFSYNAYNGWTPGIVLYSGYIPGFRHRLSLIPQWDFNNSRMVGSASLKYTFYQVYGFESVTVAGKYSDHSSSAGWQLAADLTQDPSLFTAETWKLRIGMDSRTLNAEGLDAAVYSPGIFKTLMAGGSYSNRPNVWWNVSSNLSVTAGISGGSFIKWQNESSVRRRWTKNISTDVRSWVGGFLANDDVPSHFYIFMAGGVDPHFTNSMVLDRTGVQRRYNLYDEQYLQDGPGLRGRAGLGEIAPTAEFAWGLNFSQSLPHVPVKLFLDFAGNETGTYYDSGIQFGVAGFNILIPLVQSWDEQSTPDGFGWILDRARFSITVSTGIRIG